MNTCASAPLDSARSWGSLWFRGVQRDGWTEFLLGAAPATDPNPSRWAMDLGNFLLETGATLVELDAFGDTTEIDTLRGALGRWLDPGFPSTLLIHSGNHGPDGGGLLARAMLGVKVEKIASSGRCVGFRFEDEHAAYCYLGGMLPADAVSANPSGQTLDVISQIKTCLEASNMNFRDVVRTWFYLDDILLWYDDFNHTRTTFFNEHDVFSRLMPASTGIGIANHSGLLPLAKVHACRAKSADVRVSVAESPLQGSAFAYGSAFSRAVTVATPAGVTLHVSGTASIAPGGETEYLDEVAAQITRTMEVVQAILRASGMDWADAVRGIAYFHHAEDLRLWGPVRAAYQLPENVVIAVHADVCRHDLLFELELEARRS